MKFTDRQDFSAFTGGRWLRWGLAAWLFTLPSFATTPLASPTASPDLDEPGQPFTWAAFPTDEIGIADASAGTEITPEGSLYTGYGELFFMVGDSAQRVQQRTRTLGDGDLPIVNYDFNDRDVKYHATLFSWALDPVAPDRDPVNYIRIIARNSGSEAQTTTFTVAFCYSQTNSHRFSRPANPKKPGRYSQPGVEFDPHWTYRFQCKPNQDFALRSNKVVYELPAQPQPQLFLTATQPYRQPAAPSISQDTPVLLAAYKLTLKPDEQRELDFKMPVHPIAQDDVAALRLLQAANLNDVLADASTWWRAQLTNGLQLHIGEDKVEQTFQTSLMYLMLARDRVESTNENGVTNNLYIQTVNRLQYHAFWLRDGSHMVHAYDLTGHSRRAGQDLSFFARFQKPDGEFLSQPGEHDGLGEALWAYGQHFELTGDRAFAESVFPRVERAVEWLKQARAQDSLHVLPGGAPHDDELPRGWGHLTGDNFYALAGLHEAIQMARALDHRDLASEWQKQYRQYHDTLFSELHALAETNGGYMPACLDNAAGRDWGNLLALYPHELLAPMDPLVTATLNHALTEYGEGLMCWGPQLHQYLTMNNTEAWIARGQEQHALDELYAILVHTSSTQAGWECGPAPWTTRDFGNDLAPHGWFAADYIAVVRNMLIRENGNELELLTVLSPSWSEPGETLWMTNAPTTFGPLNFKTQFTRNGMDLQLDEHFRSAPKNLRLHFPWYVKINHIRVDGRSVHSHGNEIRLPADTHTVAVDWQRTEPDLSQWSYVAAVQKFKDEWREHCQKIGME